MKTTKSYAQFHVNEVARVATAAHRALMAAFAGHPGSMDLWLYYRPMELGIFHAAPDETWTLAIGERIPTHLEVGQLVRWVACRAGQVPYLTE